ncbi:MAG TPA: hypothetical protein VNP72_06590 [Longimicrobium sp.]|nr:hypothetical protein [Longimicrobium sp.]
MGFDTAKYRPLRGGIMIQNSVKNTAGTLGLVVRDKTDNRRRFLLTALHVIFDPDKMKDAQQIYQPPVKFNGDVIASWDDVKVLLDPDGAARSPMFTDSANTGKKKLLEDYIAIEIDARLAADVGWIRDIGQVGAVQDNVVKGDRVRVRGAGTGQSAFGTIEAVDHSYTAPNGSTIAKCILASVSDFPWTTGDDSMTTGADSGAIVVTETGLKPVGMVHGVDAKTGCTVIYPMARVLANTGTVL